MNQLSAALACFLVCSKQREKKSSSSNTPNSSIKTKAKPLFQLRSGFRFIDRSCYTVSHVTHVHSIKSRKNRLPLHESAGTPPVKVSNTILVGLPNARLREKGGDNAQKKSPSPLSLFDDSSHHFVTSSLLNIGLFIILNAKTNTTFLPYSIRNSSLCAHIKTSRAAGLTPARPSLDIF